MEACIIKKVKIERLWGVKDIECQLNDDVNVIIGANGSGKSTFLNLIEGVLQCDAPMLMSVQFKVVTLYLAGNPDFKYIKVKQEQIEDSLVFTYSFGKGIVFKFNSYDSRRIVGRYSYRGSTVDEIRKYLDGIVKTSWLSVNRFNPFLERDRDRAENRSYMEIDDNLVNTKVRTLMHELVVYRLRLTNHINQLANKQNQEVFSLLLFNKEYDVFNPDKVQAFSQMEARGTQLSLFKIFRQLGISTEKRDAIVEHIQAMSEVVKKVQNGENLNLNDVFPLSLINRTISLIEISKRYSEEIDKILEPVKKYQNCLQRFMEDKEFSFSDNSGELHIDIKPIMSKEYKDKELVGRKSIGYNSLSSGEKQLLILLTQTLLQESKNYVFIADEPELSLHIDWQHKIIEAIRELNPNAQIIVATHSPEIAGKWQKHITNLQNVTTYGE